MRENEGGKRPYVKPVAVFVDSRDAELRFSQEMLAQIRQVRREAEEVRSI